MDHNLLVQRLVPEDILASVNKSVAAVQEVKDEAEKLVHVISKEKVEVELKLEMMRPVYEEARRNFNVRNKC